MNHKCENIFVRSCYPCMLSWVNWTKILLRNKIVKMHMIFTSQLCIIALSPLFK